VSKAQTLEFRDPIAIYTGIAVSDLGGCGKTEDTTLKAKHFILENVDAFSDVILRSMALTYWTRDNRTSASRQLETNSLLIS